MLWRAGRIGNERERLNACHVERGENVKRDGQTPDHGCGAAQPQRVRLKQREPDSFQRASRCGHAAAGLRHSRGPNKGQSFVI